MSTPVPPPRSLTDCASNALHQGHRLIDAETVAPRHFNGRFMVHHPSGNMAYSTNIPFPQTTHDLANIRAASHLMKQALNLRVAAGHKLTESDELKRRAHHLEMIYVAEVANAERTWARAEKQEITEYVKCDRALGCADAPFHPPSRIKNQPEIHPEIDSEKDKVKGKEAEGKEQAGVEELIPTQVIHGRLLIFDEHLWLANGPTQPTTGKEVFAEHRLAIRHHSNRASMASVGQTGCRFLSLQKRLEVLNLERKAWDKGIEAFELEKLALESEVQAKRLDVHVNVRNKMGSDAGRGKDKDGEKRDVEVTGMADGDKVGHRRKLAASTRNIRS